MRVDETGEVTGKTLEGVGSGNTEGQDKKALREETIWMEVTGSSRQAIGTIGMEMVDASKLQKMYGEGTNPSSCLTGHER